MRRVTSAYRLARAEAAAAAWAGVGAAAGGRDEAREARAIAARCLADPAAFAAARRLSAASSGRPAGWALSDPAGRAMIQDVLRKAGPPPRAGAQPEQHRCDRSDPGSTGP